MDCATPIIIRGKHIASLATGQLLLQQPDLERFRKQARLFGADETQYLKALAEIPVVSAEKLRDVTAFLGSLAVVVSELGYARLKSREETAQLEREMADRRRIEAALRESERKYKALVETTDTGFVILDYTGQVIDANAEYVRLTGRAARSEVIGHTVMEWTAEQDRQQNAEAIRQCAERGTIRNLDLRYVSPSGQLTPIEINATVVSSGDSPRILSLCRDISARKQAEELRIRMETQMLQVQKLESLGLLAGGIAHDFNNLLTGVLGNVDLALADSPSSTPIRANLESIDKAAQQAAELCRQMLDYSGKGHFVIQTIDLRELATEMIHMLEVSISKKTAIHCQFADPVPAIDADPSQIRQVIMNLIINASEAIGEQSGDITLAIGAMICDRAFMANAVADSDLPEGKYAYLEVTDTGCGLDAATQSRIFEPFFTTKFTGRGLGLAAVLGIVRGHKGAIKVTSEKGKGSTFRVLFPAVSRTAKRLAPPTARAAEWKGSGTVLLADDEPIVRDIGKRILERIGFRVILAADGNDAVNLFRAGETHPSGRIDCVVLDATMPHMDGAEAFREIRITRPDVPVILSSGYDQQDVSRRFAAQPFSGFVQKPYRATALAAMLRSVLEARPARS